MIVEERQVQQILENGYDDDDGAADIERAAGGLHGGGPTFGDDKDLYESSDGVDSYDDEDMESNDEP